MRQIRRASFTAFALLVFMLLSACASDDPRPGTGTVSVSLVGQAASGTIYRLRRAIVLVQGPASTTFWNTEDDLTRTTLSANVAAGDYYSFLQEGWQLEKLVAGNPPAPVTAQLISPNPTYFTVVDDMRTTVPLRFRVPEGEIDMDQGYGIVIEVEEETSVTPGYCTTDAQCGGGQTCCLAGFLGTCRALTAGQACPLPDLTVSADAARTSLSIGHETFAPTSCALVEGCVAGPGDRRLLRFSTETPNIGAVDMVLGDPSTQPGFESSTCHGHYHFEGYAEYQLLDKTGAVAATGHKQAFCLLDLQSLPGTTTGPRFHCGFQGISAGWSDVYGSGLDCQWVDITGVAPGSYLLRITVNGARTLPESNYDNNTIQVPVTIPADGVIEPPGDPLAACSAPVVGPNRDCGWEVASGQQAVACVPGTPVTLGCGCGTDTCGSDPVLRVCDGGEACIAATALASIDDTCGLCPQAGFVCPASGTYTVLTAPYAPGSAYACQVSATP